MDFTVAFISLNSSRLYLVSFLHHDSEDDVLVLSYT